MRNAAGAPAGDVPVRLERAGALAAETRTTPAGNFSFSPVAPGDYTVTAGSPGGQQAQSTVQAADASDSVDLRLAPSAGTIKTSPPPGRMEFADEPNFTIAAVTDWTAAGGHGSDTVLRASEALNREAIGLPPNALPHPPGPLTEPTRQRESALRAALARAPDSFAANHDLGAFCLQAQRDDEAVPALEAAWRIRPENAANELDLARALQGAGQFADARGHVGTILAHGDNANAERLAGELDEKLGDPMRAARELRRAVQLEPSEPNYFAWGSELLLHRAVLQAKEVFSAGLRTHPDSERIMTALGAALFAGALYDQAALRLCAASDLAPDDVAPYLFMGRIVAVVPTPLPCVVPRLQRFTERQPANPLASYYYAMALWKQKGQPVDATADAPIEALLRRATTLDARCAPAWLQLGVLHFSRGEYKDSIGFFRQAIAADPQLSDAYYRLGMAYDRVGERDQAKLELDLHEKIDREQKEQVDRQRRAITQFRVSGSVPPPAPPSQP